MFLGHGALESSYQFTEDLALDDSFTVEWTRLLQVSFAILPHKSYVGHSLLALVRLDNSKVQPTANQLIN